MSGYHSRIVSKDDLDRWLIWHYLKVRDGESISEMYMPSSPAGFILNYNEDAEVYEVSWEDKG